MDDGEVWRESDCQVSPFGREVANIAAISFSSWGLRLRCRPGSGWELLVMEQLFIGCRYTRAGILARERKSLAYLSVMSEMTDGTARTEGYVAEY